MRVIKRAVLPIHEGCKIIRPITDPEWNRKQMNTRKRCSKKMRLEMRRAFREAVNAKAVKNNEQ